MYKLVNEIKNSWKSWLEFFNKLSDDDKYLMDDYTSIKQLQLRTPYQDPILTPRQKLLSPNQNMFEFFLFTKQLKDKKLSNFLWLYFQGGLPIRRNLKCVRDNCKLSHNHILEKCDIFAESLQEGLVIGNILFHDIPPSSEQKLE